MSPARGKRMTTKPKCARCGKEILGKVKIIAYRKKLGTKSVPQVDTYDEACFKLKNKERALSNGCCRKKRKIKRRSKK